MAAQERRQAEARVAELSAPPAGSAAGARPLDPALAPAERALARAQAWEAALEDAAVGAMPQDADLVVAKVQGAAQLVRGGEALPIRRGVLLREADEIVTSEGKVELRFHDGSSLALPRQSQLRVLQAPRAAPQQSSYALGRGGLAWESRTQGFTRVMTPRSLAQLKSGRTTLTLDADGAAKMAVYAGSAELLSKPDPAAPPGNGPWDDVYK